MRSSILLTSIIIAGAPAFAAPSELIPVERSTGSTSGRYIVKLKDGATKETHMNWLKRSTIASPEAIDEWDPDVLHGYAGNFDDDTLNYVRASEDVDYIAEDGPIHAYDITTQTDAPWGLERISQEARVEGSIESVEYAYKYDAPGGSGVDIYVLDTGIYTENEDFGGRAKFGASFVNNATEDGNGHGTHAAGSAAGTRYGVAKDANLIAVKVLNDDGSGSVSFAVAGLSWVSQQVKASNRPSIVTLSLGGPPSIAFDQAVSGVVKQGIHVTVAAGNDNKDARKYSPARVSVATTVGASGINDERANFSNYGSSVDIFAPGVNITSTSIGNTTAVEVLSGTSMACPYVAGLAAYFIGRDGDVAPAVMSKKLKTLSTRNVLSNIPKGTPNLLARNGV